MTTDTETTQDGTCIYVLSVKANGEEAEADVRLVLPKYKRIASCDGDSDGAVLDMLVAHGLPADEAMLSLLEVGDRDGDAGGYIERTDGGWEIWRRDGSEVVEGGVTLYADPGQPTVNRRHPYGTCGNPLEAWCSDVLIQAINRAHGRGSDDTKDILAAIVAHVDQATQS